MRRPVRARRQHPLNRECERYRNEHIHGYVAGVAACGGSRGTLPANYDFQSAGEFVSLRDDDGMEIQTRQAVISTTFTPGPDAHDELATCVSLNSAVAARVGDQRVTYQPNLSGVPDPSGLQLRVDGELITLGAGGLDLEAGGRVVKTSVGGIEIDFPNETVLIVTPGWWAAQSKWYLNVDVFHTPAEEGILGIIPPRSWLPALPDGTSMGPMPGPLHERYVVLYQKFADVACF